MTNAQIYINVALERIDALSTYEAEFITKIASLTKGELRTLTSAQYNLLRKLAS